ncbi:MAG: hypothetical protein HYX67_09025 [Candidatus Melainabacteria bacterium]|nr:hypothetical protein [Candidatus Melainabacteria bacterium]
MRYLECLTTACASTVLSVALTIGLVTASLTAAHAAGSQPVAPKGTAVQTAIAQIEDKLYEHKYPAESDDARLTRIEKFVFGAAQTGTTAERLQRLQASITSQADAIDKPPAPATQAKAAPVAAATDAVTSTPAFDSANYPRVTELEQDMLNATYVHEPLPKRLSRLESKAFGKPSNSNDLCARVDDLDEYAETHKIFKNHKDPLNSAPVASASRSGVFSNSILSGRGFPTASDSSDNDFDDAAPKAPVNPFIDGVTGTDQRLSAIEEFVYGHNYATRPAQDRLARLEKRLVPYQHNLAQKDVTSRVNNLWNILNVANTFKNVPTAAHPANAPVVATAPAPTPTPTESAHTVSAPSQSTLTQATATHHSWLHQLGKSLGSANVSSGASNVPGVYPPDMGPKPGHLWMP